MPLSDRTAPNEGNYNARLCRGVGWFQGGSNSGGGGGGGGGGGTTHVKVQVRAWAARFGRHRNRWGWAAPETAGGGRHLKVRRRRPDGDEELGDPEIEDAVELLGELDERVVARRVLREVDAVGREDCLPN